MSTDLFWNININSLCDLKCEWCYNRDNKSPEVDIDVFRDFHSNVMAGHLGTISIIGGEPTLHSHFFDLLDIVHNDNIILSTNGIRFADEYWINRLLSIIDVNKFKIAMSIKGFNKETVLLNTGVDCYKNQVNAIRNIKKYHIDCMFIYVLNKVLLQEEINCFIDFIIQNEIDKIVISDERPSFISKKVLSEPCFYPNLNVLDDLLVRNGINTIFRLNEPLCKYNEKFILKLIEQKRLITGCGLRTKGLFFSSQLELIPCNEVYASIGKYKKEFGDYKSMTDYLSTEPIVRFYQKISTFNNIKCKDCSLNKICRGGCLLFWYRKEKE